MENGQVVSKPEILSMCNRFDFEKLRGRSILVTGGTGLIGKYLVSAMNLCTSSMGNKAPKITVVSRSAAKSIGIPNYNNKVKLINMDLSQMLPKGNFDTLIHGASPASPGKTTSLNDLQKVNSRIFEEGIHNIIELESILFISSGEVYGKEAPIKVKESYKAKILHDGPRSHYPLAKLHAEELLLQHCASKFDVKIARLFHSFGPGLRSNDGRSFADFIYSVAFGKLPTLLSTGSQVRTFLYLEDAIIGLLEVLTSNYTAPVNVGSEESLTIREFASEVSRLAGFGGKLSQDLDVAKFNLSPNFALVPDVSKLKQLGWTQCVSLESSIRRTLSWVKSNFK